MSLRSAIVDGLIADAGINALISGRAFDYFYEFEDFLNRKANANKFPAITVEEESWENEQNQDGHDNIINSSFSITLYQQVHLGNLRSRSATVRANAKATVRAIDTLNDLVVAYLNTLSGTLSSYYLRNAHITGVSDGIFQTELNREIITKEIDYTVLFSN
jgi:translation initiation factor 2 beta subunit (eIF-2beta)/eIF-5